jgi:hypothetical protein
MPTREPSLATRIELVTPPIARVVPEHVFDAYGWCESDRLTLWRPRDRWDEVTRVTSQNPPGMVFLLEAAGAFLPSELARLHAVGYGFEDETVLVPWGIDHATDTLWERRQRPREALSLATDSLAGLVWGMHDWAHFHNHGPFEEVAWTELQCDLASLSWLWVNRTALGVSESKWEAARRDLLALSRERFAGERKELDPSLFDPEPLVRSAERALKTRAA